MDSFKIVGYGKTFGDETTEYIIKVSPTATVREVLVDIVNQKGEWGYIGIKDDKEPFFGSHRFEYGNGKSEKVSEDEETFWNGIMNRKVIAMEGSGGWTRSDYQLVLEKEPADK